MPDPALRLHLLVVVVRVIVACHVHVGLFELLHESLELGVIRLANDLGLFCQQGRNNTLTAIFTTTSPFSLSIWVVIAATALSIVSIAAALSVEVVDMT